MMSGETGRELLAGVELGGTKCICILGSGPHDVRAQRAITTTDPETTLWNIERALSEMFEMHGPPSRLGIASFGPVDLDVLSPRYGFITSTPKPGWRDTNVAARLRDAFGIPVSFDTDVNAAALAVVVRVARLVVKEPAMVAAVVLMRHRPSS